NPGESLFCDVTRQLNVLHKAASCFNCYDIRNTRYMQLNVLHQAASCFSRYDIRDIVIHVHICNALLIGLLISRFS
ncbi:hypothetical protein T265_13700, partial [Opisthorchis viverrini]